MIGPQHLEKILELAEQKGLISSQDRIRMIRSVTMNRTSKSERSSTSVWDLVLESGFLDQATMIALAGELGLDIDHGREYLRGATDEWNTAETKAGGHSQPIHDHGTLSLAEALSGIATGEELHRIKHYEILSCLGQGGMGRVYKAWDTELKRMVAIKVIRGDSPELSKRFLQEAYSQARIDHPHVCKIYERGLEGTQSYIAMPFIEGSNLSTLQAELNLEQKVKIIKEVAEGLQAAHRLGLIHRDIKPGNIMVEQTDTGYFPYLMDFGLAKELAQDGMTMSGTIVGTPWYMSPEQARGDIRSLDRRTDIYSLGATFYHLIVGNPPFPDKTGLEVIAKVLSDDPVPPRQIIPHLPIDIETIIMKCMEKDPLARYESAQQLALDLHHYLEGEPISAHRPSLVYRIRKKVIKHKPLVTAALIVFCALIVFGGFALRTSLRAREQAHYLIQFNQEVRFIDEVMRFASAAPLHDLTREKNMIRERLESLKRSLTSYPDAALAPGYYALGRGYMALHEYEQANDYLQKAWNSGFQGDEVAYALGFSLGKLYQAALTRIHRIDQEDKRQSEELRAREQYRTPALQYLMNSRTYQVESPDYAEALIARYEGRVEDALLKAKQALAQKPWLIEAQKLIADMYLEQYLQAIFNNDRDQLRTLFQKSQEAYLAALAAGPSDTETYLGLADLYREQIDISMLGVLDYSEEAFQKGLEACSHALITDPENQLALVKKAYLFLKWGRIVYEVQGQDPLPIYSQAIETAQEAVRLQSDDPFANYVLGASYWGKSIYELDRGLDPRPSIDQAILVLEKTVTLDQNDMTIRQLLGTSYFFKAQYEYKIALDPFPSFDRAINWLTEAIEHDPERPHCYIDLSFIYNKKGTIEFQLGLDPSASLETALEMSQKAHSINPHLMPVSMSYILAASMKAKYVISVGDDASPILESIKERCASTLEQTDYYYVACYSCGYAYLLEGIWLARQNQDPCLSFQEARTLLEQSVTPAPQDKAPFYHLGCLEYAEGSWLISQGQSATSHFQNALERFQHALSLDPTHIESYIALAQTYRLSAEWLLSKHHSPENHLENGLSVLKTLFEFNQTIPEAQAEWAILNLLKGPLTQTTSPETVSEADALFRLWDAASRNPWLQAEYKQYL
ncbi:protein kinase [bacterium]|nr:protein kinase [bacterium]